MTTEKIKQMSDEHILDSFGICIDSEQLSDGSRVWNILTSDAEIPCLSERHANELALAIAAAIRNATTL